MLAIGHQVNDAAKEESKGIIVKDIAEVKDVVLSTLLDVAKFDSSGSARVIAARALMEMVEKAENSPSDSDVMKDQSEEIKGMLKLIHQVHNKATTA